jgi:phenylalanyl-tRNA synthetase alpha chain
MLNDIKKVLNQVEKKIETIKNQDLLEQFKLEFLVKKGKIQSLMNQMKTVPKEDKPLIGKELNILRNLAQDKYNELKEKFENEDKSSPDIDLTLPGRTNFKGAYHPVLQTIRKMTEIFSSMGFDVAQGPEIEDNYHNFDALNFPKDHPARDMQDTFFVTNDMEILLRTHTSPVQIRVMQNQEPPIRSIMPGRVYRNESIDSTHLAEFHQIEGLYIDKDVTLAELKATMMLFAKKMYGNDLTFRFRPSFFPFTEPSAELDISKDGGKTWMEVAGCGMVHPNVLKSGGIDPEEFTGYAFGFGIERVTMLSTEIDDIRSMYENDIRIIKQF